MQLTPDAVTRERAWIADRSSRIVPIINSVRSELGTLFGTDVNPVTTEQYEAAVENVFVDDKPGVVVLDVEVPQQDDERGDVYRQVAVGEHLLDSGQIGRAHV